MKSYREKYKSLAKAFESQSGLFDQMFNFRLQFPDGRTQKSATSQIRQPSLCFAPRVFLHKTVMRQLLTVLLLPIAYFSSAQLQQPLVDSMVYGTNGVKAKFPNIGMVVGIYQNGKTNYYSFGTRFTNRPELVDSTTIFEIGSATKTFTALLLAEAIREKKVGKNDFIDKYLAKDFNLPAALKNKIKLTDLASHQSGLPNLSNDIYFENLLKKDPGNPFRVVDSAYLYSVLKQTDSLHGYGKYQYNNYAFSLLGEILAKLNQTTYSSLISTKILKPLHMNYTSLSMPVGRNVAGLYSQQGQPREYLVLDAVNPAGGLKSNAVDLMNYLKAHLGDKVYSNAVQLTQQPYYKDERRTVGLAWEIKDGYYQKDGDTFGNSMLMRYNPSKKIAIVVLSNHQNGQLVSDAVDFIYNGLIK